MGNFRCINRTIERGSNKYIMLGFTKPFTCPAFVMQNTDIIEVGRILSSIREIKRGDFYRYSINEIKADIVGQIDRAEYEKVQKLLPDGYNLTQEADVYIAYSQKFKDMLLLLEGDVNDDPVNW